MLTRRQLIQNAGIWGASKMLPSFISGQIQLQTPYQNGYGVYLAANETTTESGREVNTQTRAQYIQMHMIPMKGWAFYDSIVLPLEAIGQRFVFMLYGMPGQVAPLSDQNLLDESGNLRQDQVDFLESYATEGMTRYKGAHIWKWAEESDAWHDRRDESGRLSGGFGGKYPEYVEVLRALRRALDRARQSGCQGRLCLSSLAFENWLPPEQRPVFDMEWINKVALAGGLDLVDMWGCNYYAPGFYPFHGNGSFSIINKLKKAQAKLPTQYRNKPIFVNTGQPANMPGQESYMSQAAAHLWAAPFLHGLPVEIQTVFCWQRWGSGDSVWGLLDQHGRPNPAHHQFRMSNQFMPTKPIAATGDMYTGYHFTLPDGLERRLKWACTDTEDIQSVASWWHKGTSVIDIMNASKGFGVCQ